MTGLDSKRSHHMEYSVGFAITEPVRHAICLVPAAAWQVALDADGDVCENADVAELTGLLQLPGWPAGMRVIVRREHPPPEAPLTPFEQHDGWRYQAFATNTTAAWKPGTAPTPCTSTVEDRIRHAKDTGLRRLPSREYAINQAWLTCITLAADLTAWLRLLTLPDSHEASEPKALRYRLLHVRARLTRGGRRRRLRFPRTWPWARAVMDTFTRVIAIPAPADTRSPALTNHHRRPRRTAPRRHAEIKSARPEPGPPYPPKSSHENWVTRLVKNETRS